MDADFLRRFKAIFVDSVMNSEFESLYLNGLHVLVVLFILQSLGSIGNEKKRGDRLTQSVKAQPRRLNL